MASPARASKSAYGEIMKQLLNDGVQGGGYFDGAPDADAESASKELREYEASTAAKAKESVVRSLARALSRAGVSVDAEGDLDTVVSELVKQLPNPKRGKTFAASAAAQEKVCRVVADVLNDEFTPGKTRAADKLIDTSLSAVEICRAVGEWAHSFSSGVNTEFLAVHRSVTNSVRKLEVLGEIMSETMGKIRKRTGRAGDEELSRDLVALEDLYGRAQQEHKRTLEVLKGILNVTLPPAAKSLEIAMHDHSELNSLVKKLNLKPGTSDFSDTLAMAVSGLGTTASVAQRVNKALKLSGITVREYIASPGFEDLQRKLDSRVESGEIDAKDLAKFLKAVEELRSAFGVRESASFRAALEEVPDNVGGYVGGYMGGADDDDIRSPLQRRTKKAKSENEIVVKDFTRRLARHYDEFLSAIKQLGPHLGKEVKLTDHTDKLRDAINVLKVEGPQSSSRLEFALIGASADADARKIKEQFLSRMRVISNACEDLLALEMYRGVAAHFSRVKAAVESVEKTIDYFASVFAKKVGTLDYTMSVVIDEVSPEIASSALSLQEAVNEFVYLYYVARVRVNLSLTSAELATYGEKYVDLLGDAVAKRIRLLEKSDFHLQAYLKGANTGIGAVAWADPMLEPNRIAIRAMITREYAVKKNFYKALQAIDLYMKIFTEAIAKDPDAVLEIKKILDGTQVIARWFNESTGDAVWKAFESSNISINFDNANQVDRPKAVGVWGIDNDDLKEYAGSHYYDKVKSAMTATPAANTSDRFAVPRLGFNATEKSTKRVRKYIDEAFDSFQALKNLINAFARIGDTFGGRELHSAVFMSPTQIHKALTDFMKASALSINYGDEQTAAIAAWPAHLVTPTISTPLGPVGGATPDAGFYGLGDVRAAGAPAAPIADPGVLNSGVGSWQAYFSSIAVGNDGAVAPLANLAISNYKLENTYFAAAIKAMGAKILTVVGVYDMFERTSPLRDLTPVRMIIGGADEAPEATVAAAELYYRLPRLAEFYYTTLDFGASTTDQIALVSDFEGDFAGLIQFIFTRTTAQSTGDYSEGEVRILVREVNAIYQKFAETSPEGTTGAAIAAFIKEVNRRYGVVKKADYDVYRAAVLRQYNSQNRTANETNYAILPGEGDMEVSRMAPSDRAYVRDWDTSVKDPFSDRPDIESGSNLATMLKEFRKKIDKKFESADYRESDTDLIRQARAEMERATSATAKLAIAAKLIRGEAVKGDRIKQMMFHETVVAGLNTLSAVQSMLCAFQERIDHMNPTEIEDRIMDAIYAATTAGSATAGLTGNPAAAVEGILAAGHKQALIDLLNARGARGMSYFGDSEEM